MPVIVGALGMIKKGKDKLINKIRSSVSRCEIQKNCTLWNSSLSLESNLNVTEKNHPKEAKKKHKFIECI